MSELSEYNIVNTLLGNLSDSFSPQHNVQILKLIRQVSPVKLDKALEMFECLQYKLTEMVCTEALNSQEDQMRFYEISSQKQNIVVIPSEIRDLDCNCQGYMNSMMGQGSRLCQHIMCIKMARRLKEGRLQQIRLNRLDYLNELKSKVIV